MSNPVKDAIEALYKPIESIVKTLAGPAAEEIGLSFRDSIQAWRFRRQVRLFKRVKEICDRAGIKPQAVKLSLLFDIVDKASFEEDDELQDRWANLLSNAADPEYKGLISTAFPDILKQMSKDEAIFLEKFYRERDVTDEERKRKLIEEGISQVYLDNLVRLKLIEWFEPSDDPFRSGSTFFTTAFGVAFISACTNPRKRKRQ